MTYQLSLLDKCPVNEGISTTEALHNTVRLAQVAEESGFLRFWVAEHHHSENFASSAPEVLGAYLLASTRKIRIGTGGVMLQHYSPYKVAEVFNLLSALAPGRVDIGIGKAPGGLPASTRALQIEMSDDNRLPFIAKIRLLNQLLGGEVSLDGLFEGIAATPKSAEKASGFLLGASAESALLAAELGWQMSYAGHLNGSETQFLNTLKVYQEATNGKIPQIALSVIVSDSQDEALEKAEDIAIYKVHFANQRSFSLPTYESAQAFAEQSGRSDYEIQKQKTQVIAGTVESVSLDLQNLHKTYGIQEFMLETPTSSFKERVATVELLGAYHQRHIAQSLI